MFATVIPALLNRTRRSGHASVAFLVALLVLSVPYARSQPITIVRDGIVSQHAVVRVSGNAFISARELAALVDAHSYGAFDSLVAMSEGNAAFAAGTPFVWTTRGSTRRLLQLPVSPIVRSGSLYVPVWGAVRVLQTISSKPISYDPQRERLTYGLVAPTPPPPIPVVKAPRIPRRDSIRSILVEARANGVLVSIEYTSPPLVKPTAVVMVGNHARVELGNARYDTSNAKFFAGATVDDQYFTVTRDTLALHMTVVDSIQSSSRKITGSTALLTFRTSRRTEPVVVDPNKERWKMDIVVLDAGHGGQDPGAQGLGGTNEADVTLSIVLKLGKILEKAGLKVVYTRTSDVFVELYRRAQIANEARGKLFISVHCNSMPTKPNPANGFESYILRPGKNESAVRVAQRENNVIGLEEDRTRYQSITEEAFIVAAMAQSGFVKYSERFATQVQSELARVFPGAKNNGVSQAGFLVLVGASMPNILIETGYISHPREERLLASNAGQQRFAEGIAAAVKKYRTSYEHAMRR